MKQENSRYKFRAWWVKDIWNDEPKGIMLHNVQDFYDTLGQKKHGNEYEPESSFGGILNNPDQYIVMQFTGLKDKNGKEIYEGDIVKQLTSGEHDKWARKIIVRWNNEWSGFYPFFTLSGHSREEIYEIIGNIYENPELL